MVFSCEMNCQSRSDGRVQTCRRAVYNNKINEGTMLYVYDIVIFICSGFNKRSYNIYCIVGNFGKALISMPIWCIGTRVIGKF